MEQKGIFEEEAVERRRRMPERAKCREAWCNRPVHADGLCNACYKKKQRREKKEIKSIYARHWAEQAEEDLGIERDRACMVFAGIAAGVFRESGVADLKGWIEKNITLPSPARRAPSRSRPARAG